MKIPTIAIIFTIVAIIFGVGLLFSTKPKTEIPSQESVVVTKSNQVPFNIGDIVYFEGINLTGVVTHINGFGSLDIVFKGQPGERFIPTHAVKKITP